MIRSFKCFETEKISKGLKSTEFPPNIQVRALDKLIMIKSASKLTDLKVPPGNRLEQLKGKKREGQFSIRINDQWRICFKWENGEAIDVEIVDYHT
jgi:proteic killer suppression protein